MNQHIKKTMKTVAGVLALTAVALGSSCEPLSAPDLNSPSLESLTRNPTRSGILAASTGLIIGHRTQVAQTNGFVSLLGILGRESYCFDKADSRFISEMLEAPALDSSSPAFGGNEWQQPYQNIRNAFIVLGGIDAVPVDPVGGLSADEKLAITGFAQTMQALDFMVVHNTRWTNGGPIDVNRTLDEDPAPIVSKELLLEHVVDLLDDAAAKLEQSGASSFPFGMGNGFASVNTPDSFLAFNRGLRARVAMYQKDYPAAETALGLSFLDASPGASLAAGVYHAYGTGSGDVVNNLVSPNILAHPKLVTEAEAGDTRVAAKLRQLVDEDGNPTTQTSRGITTGYAFSVYAGNTSPVPILKNEDLILLRAETRWFRGDIAGATADINYIRGRAGLGTVTEASLSTETAFVDELLKQRRYSMMFEGGHRWIDLRRFNRLADPSLKDLAAHNVHVMFPIPSAECLARGPDDPSVAGKCLF